MNITLAERLLHEADLLISYESTLGITDFPQDTILDEGEHLACAASTYADNRMIYLMHCWGTKRPELFFAIETGEGGVWIGRGGPWASQDEGESHYGQVPEGWTNW